MYNTHTVYMYIHMATDLSELSEMTMYNTHITHMVTDISQDLVK